MSNKINKIREMIANGPKGPLPEIYDTEVVAMQRLEEREQKKTIAKGDWKDLKKAMVDEHAGRFNEILNNMNDKQFAETYIKVLEFFKPKITRQSLVGDGNVIKEIKVNVVHSQKQ